AWEDDASFQQEVLRRQKSGIIGSADDGAIPGWLLAVVKEPLGKPVEIGGAHRSSYTVPEADEAALEPRDGCYPQGNEPSVSVCGFLGGAPSHHSDGEPLRPIFRVLPDLDLETLHRRKHFVDQTDRLLKRSGEVMQVAELLHPLGILGVSI